MPRSATWQYIGLTLAVIATAAVVVLAVSRVGAPATSSWTPPDSARDSSPVNVAAP